MHCHLVYIHWFLEGPELETLTLNQQMATQDMHILGKGSKYTLMSDFDDKTNYVFLRTRQKNLAPTEREEIKH